MRTGEHHWDSYFCSMDGAIASVFVDLDLIDEAPFSALPMLTTVRVPMLHPRPDGLTTPEEYERLVEIEDALAKASEDAAAAFVGRITTAGERDFFFYSGDGPACERHLLAALAPFARYTAAVSSRGDEGWDVYRDSLYPSPEARQLMGNRRVYDQLEKNGDPLTDPREVEHWAYFPTEDARAVFVADLEPLGYDIRDLHGPNEVSNDFCVRFARVDIPGGKFDDTVLELYRLAEAAGGRYDGWESIVVRAE